MTESKTKIFISYAKGDIETARRLYSDLESVGAAPWMDEEDLLPGQVWGTEITRAIRESRFFIALLSSHSVSKRGFFHTELKKALKILDQFPPDEIFFIPSRIDGCELPDDIAHIHCADLSPSYERGFEKILKVVAMHQQLKEIPAGKGAVKAAPPDGGRTAGDIINIHAGGDVVFSKDQGVISVNEATDTKPVRIDEKIQDLEYDKKYQTYTDGEKFYCTRCYLDRNKRIPLNDSKKELTCPSCFLIIRNPDYNPPEPKPKLVKKRARFDW